jgi:hypothetical protein
MIHVTYDAALTSCAASPGKRCDVMLVRQSTYKRRNTEIVISEEKMSQSSQEIPGNQEAYQQQQLQQQQQQQQAEGPPPRMIPLEVGEILAAAFSSSQESQNEDQNSEESPNDVQNTQEASQQISEDLFPLSPPTEQDTNSQPEVIFISSDDGSDFEFGPSLPKMPRFRWSSSDEN